MSKSRKVRSSITPGRAGVAATRLAALSAPAANGSSWYRITNKSPDCAEVMVYDEIGMWGITAKKFCEDLSAITAKTITLRINSPGGQVFDGFAIYSALKSHSAEVNVKIDGVAASIASVIAMAGDTVEIGKNAFVMIHDPASYAFGNASDLRKEAELLDKLRDSIAGVYADRSGKPLDEIKKKMSEETWLDGAEAVDFGLADAIASNDDDEDDQDGETDLARVAAKVAISSAKLPERLKRVAAVLTQPPPPPAPITPSKTETPMATKITIRDGKQFVNINGTEHEVEGSQPAPQPSNSATTITAADVSKAATDAVEKERAYRRDFTTAVAAAGMDAKVAADFEVKFYGRPIEDVKFLASNAIGVRAKAVGEGNSDTPENKQDADPEKKISDEAGKRFDSDSSVRRSYGLRNDDVASDEYKNVRQRHINGELRWHRDQAKQKQAADATA